MVDVFMDLNYIDFGLYFDGLIGLFVCFRLCLIGLFICFWWFVIGLFLGFISFSFFVYLVLRSLVGVGFLYGFCFIVIEVRKKKEICVIYRFVCCLFKKYWYLFKEFFFEKGKLF